MFCFAGPCGRDISLQVSWGADPELWVLDLHRLTDRLGHEVSRITQLRSQGLGHAELPGRTSEVNQDLGLWHEQVRILFTGWCKKY